ncbi:MAG: thymidylate kinase, partial [Chthoniobacteraceae bacterium]
KDAAHRTMPAPMHKLNLPGRLIRTFGRPLAEMGRSRLIGRLFVIEGADGSGRSTNIKALGGWLEAGGYAVRHMGLRRSPLLAQDIEQAKQSRQLTRTTMSLLYATDFYDQLVHEIIPALRAGYIVLADRYIYTLMARDIVRGAAPDWTRNLYSSALVPDAVFYLQVDPEELVLRNFEKNATLDYWESGMDLGLSRDMFESFLIYQGLIQRAFSRMQKRHGFTIIDANRGFDKIQRELRSHLTASLATATK